MGLPALFCARADVGGDLLRGHGKVSPFGMRWIGGRALPSPAIGGTSCGFRRGAGNGHIAVAVEAARRGERFKQRGTGVVDGEEIEGVVICIVGKAVDLMAAGVVGHRGVAVGVQAAEAPPRVDAPRTEVVGKVRAERVEGVGHEKGLLSVRPF